MSTEHTEYLHPADSLQEQLNAHREAMESAVAVQQHPYRHRKKFVLCFDGTGNKFSGTDADSNILKIYRMLDRNGDDQFHYYQPGIGTYVVANSTEAGSHTGRIDRIKSWYQKAKDSAVGASASQPLRTSSADIHRHVFRCPRHGGLQVLDAVLPPGR